MSLTFALVLVLVFLIFLWSAWHWYKSGELPDAWAYRIYQSAIGGAPPPETRPLELFARTQGYELDDVATAALQQALRHEEAYVAAEANPTAAAAPSTAGDAIVNSWMLANLYQFHVRPNDPQRADVATDLARDYYRRTIHRIKRNPAAAIRAPVAPERILERAIGPVDPAEQAALFEQVRLQRLRDQPDYYAPRPVAADPQNVHDTEVQNGTRRLFDRLRRLNGEHGTPDATALAELRQALEALPAPEPGKNGRPPENKKAAALFTLSRMDNGYPITALSSETLAIPERRVLTEIWLRVNAPANTGRREALLEALADALADAAIVDSQGNPTGTVCATGRCNRSLGALTLLDSDSVLAAPVKTVEILRNEVLGKSRVILETTLRDRNLFEEYERGGESPDLQVALEEVRTRIRALGEEYPDAKPETLQKVMDDALAGVA